MISTDDFAYAYASAIRRRNREPMPHPEFEPDWLDKPRQFKHYPGALSIPLVSPRPRAVGRADPAATVADGLFAESKDEPFDLGLLGSMLRESYGVNGRRLAIQANPDVVGYPYYSRANWSRGTASGGGLYPCSVYWVAGPGAGVTPGVYHYAPRAHAMTRLLAGDVTGVVGAALDEPTPAGQFLVVGVKYWANSFKYANFSYHAVSMDVGTIIQTWKLWAGGRHRVDPRFWFDQEGLSRLLGIESDAEGLFAVVPLAWAEGVTGESAAPRADVRVRRQEHERSRRVKEFDLVRRIHRATAHASTDRPAVGALAPATGIPTRESSPPEASEVALPQPSPLDMPVRAALRSRRSSFGRFSGRQAMFGADLAALLSASDAARMPTEIAAPGDGGLARFYAFVNHVQGVAPGAYAYDAGAGSLRLVREGAPGWFLQQNYFLTNYNLEQASVVVVPTIRVESVLDAVGPRGYNVANATIGAIAQAFYTAAAALGVGCGVALGFDAVSYIEHLGLETTGETPMLIMMAGHERASVSDYHYEC